LCDPVNLLLVAAGPVALVVREKVSSLRERAAELEQHQELMVVTALPKLEPP
jgi:hypothetical protein